MLERLFRQLGLCPVYALGVRKLLDRPAAVPVLPGDELWVLGQAHDIASVTSRTPSDAALTELAQWPSTPRLARFAVRRAG